jgi:hypothetical protein
MDEFAEGQSLPRWSAPGSSRHPSSDPRHLALDSGVGRYSDRYLQCAGKTDTTPLTGALHDRARLPER